MTTKVSGFAHVLLIIIIALTAIILFSPIPTYNTRRANCLLIDDCPKAGLSWKPSLYSQYVNEKERLNKSINDISTWKTLTDEEKSFQFKYPSHLAHRTDYNKSTNITYEWFIKEKDYEINFSKKQLPANTKFVDWVKDQLTTDYEGKPTNALIGEIEEHKTNTMTGLTGVVAYGSGTKIVYFNEDNVIYHFVLAGYGTSRGFDDTKEGQIVFEKMLDSFTILQNKSGWKTYTNENITINYPHSHTLLENQTLSVDGIKIPTPNSLTILHSSSDYAIEIYFTRENNNSCEYLARADPDKIIVAEVESNIFTNTPCGPTGSTIILSADNEQYFEIVIKSNKSYSEIENEIDQILSTFEFIQPENEIVDLEQSGTYCGGPQDVECPEGFECKSDGSFIDGHCIEL